jgi:glycine cleavage system H protein
LVALFMIFIVLVFLSVDFFVQRTEFRRAMTAKETSPVVVRSPHLPALPEDVFLAPSHTWAKITEGGRLQVGVDAIAATLFGEPDRIETEASGARVSKGAPLLTLVRGSRRLTLASPVDGYVVRINGETMDQPWKLPDTPFGHGWVYEIQPERMGRALRDMYMEEEARSFVNDELRRLRDSISRVSRSRASDASPDAARLAAVGGTSLDGGLPFPMLASTLDDERWSTLVQDFFGEHAAVEAAARAGS